MPKQSYTNWEKMITIQERDRKLKVEGGLYYAWRGGGGFDYDDDEWTCL
jgi:hypothetical protein